MAHIEGVGRNFSPSEIYRAPPEVANKPARAPSEGGQNLDREDIRQTASDVLETGDRTWRSDDHDARLEHFAEVVAPLSEESASELYQEILRQDPGAINSWLNARNIGDLVDEGRITAEQQTALANGFAEAYNDGDIGYIDAVNFLNSVHGNEWAPAQAGDAFTRPLDFLAAGDSEEVDVFRENFATASIEASLERDFGPLGNETAFAIRIAADSGDPAMLARIYEGLSSENRAALLTVLSDGTGYINSGEADPFSQVVNSVADHGSSASAVEIAEFAAGEHNSQFYQRGDLIRERADALGHLTAEHGEAIFTELAGYTPGIVENGQDGADNVTHAERDAVELGQFLRLTVMDADNQFQAESSAALGEYAASQREIINTGTLPNGDVYGTPTTRPASASEVEAAYGSLAQIGVASVDASQQLLGEQIESAEARQAFVNFVVDVGLSAVPLSSIGKNAVANLFGPNSGVVANALQDFGGELFDQTTGQLTDGAKEAIANALGEDAAAVVDLQTQSNVITESLKEGLDGDDRIDLETRINSLADDIAN
ncbi:MAG: hypothetical protein WA979_10115 [Pacificimonas sp.]